MYDDRFSHVPTTCGLRYFLEEKSIEDGDGMADLLAYAREYLLCWMAKEITLDNSILIQALDRICYLEDAENAFNNEDDILYARRALQKAFEKLH